MTIIEDRVEAIHYLGEMQDDDDGCYYLADPDNCIDEMIQNEEDWTLEEVNVQIETAKSQGYSNPFDETEGN